MRWNPTMISSLCLSAFFLENRCRCSHLCRIARLSVLRRCAGMGAQDRLADILVMGVTGLDLLGDGGHVAEAAFERVGVEHRRGARHVIGRIDYRGRLMDGP